MRRLAIDLPAPGAARSYWIQEALEHDPGEPAPPLEGSLKADVCIVGGGFAGLWTAIRLRALAPDLSIALIEQDIVGGGASGRNGGVMMPAWHDLEALMGLFGEEEGLRYAHVQADSIEAIGAFIDANGIDAWYHHDGFMFVRSAGWQESLGAHGRELFRGLGLSERVRGLTREEARAVADSPRFVDGTFLTDPALVQPARLARGLRRLLLAQGVHVFERTRMTGLERTRPAVVRTAAGPIKADHVVLTTGPWTADMAPFRRSFGVISDWMAATEPIPSLLQDLGWTEQVGNADHRESCYYLRPTDDGRIVIGGGGVGAVFGGRGDSTCAKRMRRLGEVPARGLLWFFPQLEGVRFTHSWGGPVDVAPTFIPFYRTLDPGNIHAALGYSGHGLVQTYIGGHILAAKVLGVEDEWTSLAVNRPELGKVPPEPLRFALVAAAARCVVRGNAREDAGLPRGWINDWVGSAPLLYRERLIRGEARRRRATGKAGGGDC